MFMNDTLIASKERHLGFRVRRSEQKRPVEAAEPAR